MIRKIIVTPGVLDNDVEHAPEVVDSKNNRYGFRKVGSKLKDYIEDRQLVQTYVNGSSTVYDLATPNILKVEREKSYLDVYVGGDNGNIGLSTVSSPGNSFFSNSASSVYAEAEKVNIIKMDNILGALSFSKLVNIEIDEDIRNDGGNS